MFVIYMTQSNFMSQIFYKKEEGKSILVAAKIFDYLKATDVDSISKRFRDKFHEKCDLGTVNQGPVKLRFFGIYTVKNYYFTLVTISDDKLKAVTEYLITLQGARNLAKISERWINVNFRISTTRLVGLAQMICLSARSTQATCNENPQKPINRIF